MFAKLEFANCVMSWRRFFTVTAIALSFTAIEARADVLFDSFAPGDLAPGLGLSLYDDPTAGDGQSLAVSFSTASAVTVNSILAAIGGTGDVTFGIMTDAFGAPSNTFLYSTVLTDPTANVSLNGLNWGLGAGSYWLAAVAHDGFSGTWPGGIAGADWAFTSGSGSTSWNLLSGGSYEAPAARITTAVPEPETYAMMLAGLGLLGAVARRRKAG